MEDIRGYIGPVAQSKLSKNPPKRDGEIFIALLPPHKNPRNCLSDDLLLLTANYKKTVGSVTRWFQRVTGFSVQLVHSNTFLSDELELGTIAYQSKDCLVAVWAVFRHSESRHTPLLDVQETETALCNHMTPVSPENPSGYHHSMVDNKKSPAGSGQKPRFKYVEAYPAPPGVDNTAWNKLYTAANARMYYKASNSAGIAKAYRTSGETYQLALTMLAEKQAISGDQKESGPEERIVVEHQAIKPVVSSSQANVVHTNKTPSTQATLDILSSSQDSHEPVSIKRPGVENFWHSETGDEIPIEKWEPDPRTIIQQQASAILRPASTRPDTVESRGTTLVEKDPVLKMLATEASIDPSLKELIKRVASSVASADEQVQLQARYEYLTSLRDERDARPSFPPIKSTISSQLHTINCEGATEEPVCVTRSFEGHSYA